MGTNYYVRTPTCEDACDHCSESELKHLGKSSVGWRFGFQADPEWQRDMALNNWFALAESGQIENEYGEMISLAVLYSLIMCKQNGRSHMEPNAYEPFGSRYFADRGFDFCDSNFS